MKEKIIVVGLLCILLSSLFISVEKITADPGNITFQFDLYEGYNLIAIPVDNDYTASSLAENITGFNIISQWNVTTQQYDDYIEGFSDPEDDFPIENGKGVSVMVENDTQFSVSGEELSGITVDLVEGYNLLGWYKSSTTTASSVFNSNPGCINVSIFDALNQTNINYQSPADEDFVISRGRGYWVQLDYDFQIVLYEGYNLITIPVENDYTASSLAEEISGCSIISEWNHTKQMYDDYIVGFSDPEDDFTIKDGIGYYVLVEDNASLTVSGLPLTDVSVDLYEGVNQWGWYNTIDTSASEVMEDIENCVKVSMYDALNQTQKDYESPGDEDFTITRGMGYMITIETPTILDPLTLDTPGSVEEGHVFQVVVTADNNPVDQVLVNFSDETYLTNSDGIVTIISPEVQTDKNYVITAYKTGYLADEGSILVLNNFTVTIELISPNGDEVWKETEFIEWSIDSTDLLTQHAITLQYQYKNNPWFTLANNILNLSSPYEINTNSLEDGYPYKIKVILKEDGDNDGSYETLLCQDSSDKPFGIDNSVKHQGWIYGNVTHQGNNSNIYVKNVKVCVIYPNQQNVITSKCILTDDNGSYSIPISHGEYTIQAYKKGYQIETIDNVTVWTNEYTEINFVLTPSTETQSTPSSVVISENQDYIDTAIENDSIGAEINIVSPVEKQYDVMVFTYNDITISPDVNASSQQINLVVDGNVSGGKTIAINIEKDSIFQTSSDLQIEYDDEKIKMADDIFDVLDPNNDGSHPEYLITHGLNGTQILVSIPHFSEHTISVYSSSLQEVAEEIMHYKEITILAAVGIIALAAIVMFRKGKED